MENEETWFLVLGSWFLVLGSWFLVLGSWLLEGIGSKAPGTRYELRTICMFFIPFISPKILTVSSGLGHSDG